MKKSALAFVFLSVLVAGFAQQKSEVAAKLLALESKWNEAYLKSDIAALNSLLSDDFIITIEDGSTFSKAGYIARCGNPNIQVQLSEMSDLKVRMHGNTAVVTGAYHERGLDQGKPYEFRDRFTDIWMNLDSRWQVVASHYAMPQKT